jgi:hypothetical protein
VAIAAVPVATRPSLAGLQLRMGHSPFVAVVPMSKA